MTPPPKDFDGPFEASRFFSAARRISPALAFLVAPATLLLAAISAAAEGNFSSPGKFSRVSDLRHLLALSSGYISTPVIPLQRDDLTMLLVVLVGYTFACSYAQCCAIAVCIPELERCGVLQWRASPRIDLIPRILRRSVDARLNSGTSSRAEFADFLRQRMLRIRRAEPFILALSAFLAEALQFAIWKARSLEVLAPYSYSPKERVKWDLLAYKSWWASYYHWPGAITFFLLATFGIFIILLQNAILSATVATASVTFAYAEPGVDWLNADGHYGWLPVERVFRASYLSVALRGLSLSALIIGFGARNTFLFLFVAIGWILFILIYHIVPYRTLFAHTNHARRAQIEILVREARRIRPARGRRNREALAFYISEIERCRNARINPMHLPKWQLSTFILAVFLPVILTIIQITL